VSIGILPIPPPPAARRIALRHESLVRNIRVTLAEVLKVGDRTHCSHFPLAESTGFKMSGFCSSGSTVPPGWDLGGRRKWKLSYFL
jgi:hypothetical protein